MQAIFNKITQAYVSYFNPPNKGRGKKEGKERTNNLKKRKKELHMHIFYSDDNRLTKSYMYI